MSERMTSVELLGVRGSGYADYGRKSVPEMIEQICKRAQWQKEVAEAILAAADIDFLIKTYRGIYVERNCEILQKGKQ